MHLPGPLAPVLRWSGVLCLGVLGVVGGLGLEGPGLVAVGVAGTLAGCTAMGIAREEPHHDRRAVLESGVQVTAWTVGVLLALAGVVVLGGGAVALLAGAAGVTVWLVVRATRSAVRPSAAPPRPPARTEVLRPSVSPITATPVDATSSVSGLTTAALGREWVRTGAALRRRLTVPDRQALVRRREEALDELERRDPAGFARWLAEEPAGSDPSLYVHGRPVQGDPAAGTDAA